MSSNVRESTYCCACQSLYWQSWRKIYIFVIGKSILQDWSSARRLSLIIAIFPEALKSRKKLDLGAPASKQLQGRGSLCNKVLVLPVYVGWWG